jgi:protocatechuate 3,4-dioxygenase beta subunit
MTLRRILPIAVLLAVLAGLLYLFLPSKPATATPDLDPAAAAEEDQVQPGTLARSDSAAAAAAEEERFPSRGLKVGLGNYGLHGTVVDERGQPVPNAWVAAFSSPYPLFDFETSIAEILEKPLAFELEPIASCLADEKGHFALEGVPGRGTYLIARASKRLTRGRQMVKPEELGTEKGILLHTVAGADLRGRVVDEFNAPVANAEIFVLPSLMYLVQAVRTREIYVERLTTGADGSFFLDAVPAGIVLMTQAFDGVTHPGSKDVGPLPAGASAELQVRLAETGDLSANIVDEEGEPVRGAKAVAVPLDLRLLPAFVRDLPAWITESGSDGVAKWPRLPKRNYLLMAQGREGRTAPYTSAVQGKNSLATEPLVVQTRSTVEGRLVDAKGSPIAQARVLLASVPSKPGSEGSEGSGMGRGRENGGFPEGAEIFLEIGKEVLPVLLPSDTWSTTDAAGRFRLPAWQRARLMVEVEGYPDTTYELPAFKDEQKPVLVLAPPGAVEGQVVAQDGAPVRFFVVNADLRQSFLDPETPDVERMDGEDGRAFSARRAEARAASRQSLLGEMLKENEVVVLPEETRFGELLNTRMQDDGTGRFRIENLMPGTYRIEARASGYAVARSEDLIVPPGGLLSDVKVTLSRGATIRGRVIAAGTREPVAGALVWAGQGDGSGMLGMIMAVSETMAIDRSDGEGLFELTGVENGADRIHASAEGYAPLSIKGRELNEGDLREDLVLEMKSGGTIQGNVTDRNGQPMPARMVGGFSMDSQDFWQTPTDPTGFYKAANVKPGNYFIMTAALDDEALFTGDFLAVLGGARLAQGVVKDGQVITVNIVDTGAGGCKVRGRILLPDGRPVARAALFAMAAESSLLDLRMASARSDAEGWFEFKSLAPGIYQLQANGGDWQGSLQMEVPDLPEALLNLTAPDGSVSGMVVSAQTGLPVPSVTVMLVREDSALGFLSNFMPGGKQTEWGQTEEDGSFRFGGVAEGNYSLSIRADMPGNWSEGDEDAPMDPLGRLEVPAFALHLNESRDLGTLKLPIASAILVRVTSDGSELQQGFSISVQPVEGTEGSSEDSWGWSGRGRVSGLEPGSYDVIVQSRGYATKRTRAVQVLASQTTEIVVDLVKGVPLAARVLDQNGQPLVDAQIEVLDSSGKPAEGMSGQGRALGGLFGGGEDGSTPLGSFEPGAYVVRVTVNGRTQQQGVSLSDGQEETVLAEFTFSR